MRLFSFFLGGLLNHRALGFEGSSSGNPALCPFSKLRGGAGAAEGCTMRSDEPDPGQVTATGCECKTSCGASISDGYKCDWCYTKDGCGLGNGITGKYDYCTYPDDADFAARGFQEKDNYFMGRIVENRNRTSGYARTDKAVTTSVQTTFYDYSDEMPAGRVKSIHTIGAVCQMHLDVSAHSPYTGLFEPGSKTGFIRMGGAISWDTKGKGITPGIGFKFARTGMHSGSTVALIDLEIKIWNFFGGNFSNHVGPTKNIATKFLSKKFEQASQCPSQVGLSDMASYTQKGEVVAAPKTPFKLFFVPSADVQRPNTPKTIDDLMAEFKSFAVGTPLLSVYACGKGNGEAENTPTTGGVERACGDAFLLGEMVTSSVCTTSAYGDEKFFFRHQTIEEDWKMYPEFLTQYDAKTACGMNRAPSPDGLPKQCGV